MSAQTATLVLLCASGHRTRALLRRLRLKQAVCAARRQRWDLLPNLPWLVADEAHGLCG